MLARVRSHLWWSDREPPVQQPPRRAPKRQRLAWVEALEDVLDQREEEKGDNEEKKIQPSLRNTRRACQTPSVATALVTCASLRKEQ